jgi:hypothetical protein
MFKHINSKSPIATFAVASGALRVTDPCYKMSTWCAGDLKDVANGTWHAHVGMFLDPTDIKYCQKWLDKAKGKKKAAYDVAIAAGHDEELANMRASLYDSDIKDYERGIANYKGRVAYIHIVHEAYKDDPAALDPKQFKLVEGLDVGVDSGQAGFFDLAEYVKVASGDRIDETFYRKACAQTLDTELSFGVVEFGALSSSGYGDGGYNCYVLRHGEGKLIAAYIEFIGDGSDEDEDE